MTKQRAIDLTGRTDWVLDANENAWFLHPRACATLYPPRSGRYGPPIAYVPVGLMRWFQRRGATYEQTRVVIRIASLVVLLPSLVFLGWVFFMQFRNGNSSGAFFTLTLPILIFSVVINRYRWHRMLTPRSLEDAEARASACVAQGMCAHCVFPIADVAPSDDGVIACPYCDAVWPRTWAVGDDGVG